MNDINAEYKRYFSDQTPEVARLIEEGVNVNCTFYGNGTMPMHIAAKNGKVKKIIFVLKVFIKLHFGILIAN